MTTTQRRRLVTLVTVMCLAWLAGMSVLMWMTLPDSSIEHHNSSAIKDRMAAECQGSFRDRYECKEAIIVESGRETFWILSARFLLVILPPLLASGWLSSYLRRHPVHNERHAPADEDWKTRAQLHTRRAPSEVEDDLPSIPYTGGGHHGIDDIAPLDDWKTKAQGHISQAKRK